ncbi:adenylate/guanylate cyclase domain-containing protein [Mycobacterium conspicuum]|uniref:Uncharacterized protein n=1 Tax=Mycobacterium conspicuum TaxID=44010 RepID=A0A1X1SXP0_9MYCO|nr:adenylate/guanylate cyclase domain-containing protein [Mycobacterium conspicuum]ORV35812.1 hypothetical protein AWC00_24745 [Mycobacterium conspicuum]BBZ37130.1 hypothetical protein MCNS_01930 [Mycobacterium conspicuum]
MRRTWTWTFDLPPDQIWPILADTNRFNEALGLPPYRLEETPQPNGTVVRRGREKAAGFLLEWEEKPYEWIAGRHFRQTRVFTKGPFRRFGPVFDLESDGKGGSRVSYTLEWEPLGVVGRLSGARLAARAGENVSKRVLEAIDFLNLARGDPSSRRLTPFVLPQPVLPQGARERATAMAREIDRSPYGNGLGARLSELVLEGMAADLTDIRPKVLAADLGVPPRAATEACLAGVKAGLLDMKWGLLCPNCRGAKISVATLSDLPHGAHCPTCNIDYDRDFERNVELTFKAAPAIRPLPDNYYCLSGPMGTQHVAVQVLLSPEERRAVSVDLPPGSYRVRTLHPGASVDVEYESGPFPDVRITASGVQTLDPVGDPDSVTFVNDAGFELAALIEDRSWTRTALTAPEVISLQAFRDLFAEATLRPGDDAGVSQVALLFTDLRGSTALYERVGDATAYNLVRAHFMLLAAIVRDHDGAVVKTIGDAVMASFTDPAQAVRAALAMQAGIASSPHTSDLVLKVGVHAGPSVVVTLNGRLDYFGSTVNMAARLQGQSAGDDIVLSHAVAADPAVQEILGAVPQRQETVPLKGFEEPVSFLRLVPAVRSTG